MPNAFFRPRNLGEFIGQPRAQEFVRSALVAAEQTNLPHSAMLFAGDPGMGRGTFAELIADDMMAPWTRLGGHLVQDKPDVAALLFGLHWTIRQFRAWINSIDRRRNSA